MNESDFANLYIERILNEVSELTKIRMLNEAKISYIEKMNTVLAEKVTNLENELEKNKTKINRKKTIELDNSEY